MTTHGRTEAWQTLSPQQRTDVAGCRAGRGFVEDAELVVDCEAAARWSCG